MKNSDLPLILKLFTEIGIIEQLAHTRLEQNLPEGLKSSQFGVLNHLVRLGGSWSPLRLANAFQVTKGAMTNTLKRLETRGLIEVIPDPEDGRGKLVSLTEAGQKMHAQCLHNLGPAFAELSHHFPDKDIAQMLPELEKLRQYLDENRD